MTTAPTREQAAEELLRRRRARESLAEYMHYVSGKEPPKHLRVLCRDVHKAMDREPGHDRTAVAFPPGHAKTTTLSHHFPPYYLSKFPDHCIIAATHTQDLAKANGRRARNIMMSGEHKNLFPNVSVSEDSAAADAWETTAGGLYLGFGVGSTVVGRRADALVLDDLLKGMEDADSELIREKLWTWYGADLYTRLKPNGIIIVIATRYHLDDLTGRLFSAEKHAGGERWHKIIYPAIAEKNDPLGRQEGEALWPDWQPLKALERIKAQPAMTPRMWSALFQQHPVIEGGNLVKRSMIKPWRSSDPPECVFTLQSWDTAGTVGKKAAFSVCLTFGVFTDTDGGPSVIILSRWRQRVEYPELRTMAQRLYHNFLDDRYDMPMRGPARKHPDTCLIEDKATGRPLLNDLRRAGILATPFQVQRYGDKDARLKLVLDIFSNGRVYAPAIPPNFTIFRRWAEEWITSLTNFPNADSRDDADATSQALIYCKTGGWVHNPGEGPQPQPYTSENLQRGAIY